VQGNAEERKRKQAVKHQQRRYTAFSKFRVTEIAFPPLGGMIVLRLFPKEQPRIILHAMRPTTIHASFSRVAEKIDGDVKRKSHVLCGSRARYCTCDNTIKGYRVSKEPTRNDRALLFFIDSDVAEQYKTAQVPKSILFLSCAHFLNFQEKLF